MASRRSILKAGAGVLLVGTGAAAFRAWDQGVFSTGQGPAYEAWERWNDPSVGATQRLVGAAILAASPHNTQPWRFRVGPGGIDLFADRGRHIGTIDPYLREMHVGLGCALENMLLAAPAAGLTPQATMFPDSANPSHVAHVTLASGGEAVSPLYAAIPERHTNRGAYDTRRSLEASVFSSLAALGSDLPQVSVRWFTEPQARREIGDAIVEATRAIVGDHEQSRDSGAWFRTDWHELQRKRDGLTIDAQALPGWLRLAAKVMPPLSTERADRIWLDATRDVHVATAPAFGLLLVRDPSNNLQRVQGGRLWQRMHLWAQTQGIAMHPLNQMPERADRERSAGLPPHFQRVLGGLAGNAEWQALMPFRLGYPTVTALRSPRRQVAEVLVS